MSAGSRRAVPTQSWVTGLIILAAGLVTVAALQGQTEPAAPSGATSLNTLARIPGVTSALPDVSVRKPQVLLFIADKSDTGEPFERRLASAEDLPRLATELQAALLFVAPPAAAADSLAEMKRLQARLRRTGVAKAPNRHPLTIVGYGSGATAAVQLFARDATLAETLVLVDPSPMDNQGAADLGKVTADARPCILLASPTAAEGAEAAKTAIRTRCEKADILEAPLPEGHAFPLLHVANVLAWSTPAAELRRGQAALGTSRVPSAGPRRIDTLQSLLHLQAAAAQIAAGLKAPVTLKGAPGAPAVAKDDALFKSLQLRMKLLAPLAEDMQTKAGRKLDAAKAAAERRVPAVVASMKRTSPARQRAIRQKFLDENFPWPDMLPEISPPVTEQQFQDVMNAKCVRCHRRCRTVQEQVRSGWIRPGLPERSPTYTTIGVHKKSGAKYHNLSDEEKRIVHDFIQQMQRTRN